MIIENASELLQRTRKSEPITRKLLKLEVGNGFTTMANKVQNLRNAAKKNNMKIATRRMKTGHFLICRTK